MPAKVKKIGRKYRVVESSGKLVRNASGTPVDGGGKDSKEAAQKQASAINMSQSNRKGPTFE